MKTSIALAVMFAGLLGARAAREVVASDVTSTIEEPFSPSPELAPILSFGYREAVADLMFARLTSYVGGRENSALGIAALVEAIAALDPSFKRIYVFGARAMTIPTHGVDQSIYRRAIAVLEAGASRFPDDWKIPYTAGQMYMLDLETTDPGVRHRWDERGAILLETAIRKPGAPADGAIAVAHLRTKLGQHERAIEGLRETLLVTNDDAARKQILERLAKLESSDSSEIAAEVLGARRAFEARWKAERPSLLQTMYVLIGPRRAPGFDLADLATGGRDLEVQPIERLEPLE